MSECCFQGLALPEREIVVTDEAAGWLRDAMKYTAGSLDIASFGQVSKKYLSMFDIKQDVFYAEINWENIIRTIKAEKHPFQ